MRKWRSKNRKALNAYRRGYYRTHKAAHKKSMRKWYRVNRSAALAAHRDYVRKNPKVRMLHMAKHRAKRDKLPFNIRAVDITIPRCCPVLGMVLRKCEGKAGPASPSLDRFIPALGYVRGNIAVISHRANAIKHDASAAEVLAVARWMAARARRRS
jgi:hypothetical protein